MVFKKWIPWLVIPILVFGLILYKTLGSQSENMRRSGPPPRIQPVRVLTVRNQTLSRDIELGGHLHPHHAIDLYAEVAGVLLEQSKWFREGVAFEKNDALIQIDDSVYRNQVMAQRSSLMNQITLLLPDLSIDFPDRVNAWTGYLSTLSLQNPLPELPEINNEQERYYIASRNIFNLYYTIKGMEAMLSKYRLYAPFDGIATESTVLPGSLIRQGQKIGVFTRTDVLELEAWVSPEDLPSIRRDHPVRVVAQGFPKPVTGNVQRVNAVLDKASQSVKVYIHIRGGGLRPGMYATAILETDPIPNVMRIPRNLMQGERHLYRVDSDTLLRLQDVEIVGRGPDHVLVRGLSDGQWIVGQSLLEAYDGMKIRLADPQNKTKAGRS